jgi:hypothetical protein
VRARQTAEDIGEAFGKKVEAPEFLLPPWEPGVLAQWLEHAPQPLGRPACWWGTSPISRFALGRWLCGGPSQPRSRWRRVRLRAAHLGRSRPGAVELIWKLPQYGLRKL